MLAMHKSCRQRPYWIFLPPPLRSSDPYTLSETGRGQTRTPTCSLYYYELFYLDIFHGVVFNNGVDIFYEGGIFEGEIFFNGGGTFYGEKICYERDILNRGDLFYEGYYLY